MRKIITIPLLFFASNLFAQVHGTLLYNFNTSDAAAIAAINGEPDSVTYYPESNTTYGQFTDAASAKWYLERNWSGGLHISGTDLITTIKDGAPSNGQGYNRSEVNLADGVFTLDTTHNYTIEWKGYFPQNVNYLTGAYQILCAMQTHSLTQVATVWGIDLDASGNLISGDVYDDYTGTDYGKGPGLFTANQTIGTLSGWYNTPHIVLLTLREGKGYAGQTAFLRIQVDGKIVYDRKTGQVGSGTFDDYVKFAGLYDWNNQMVNNDSTTRGHRFSLVTQAYKIYSVTDTSIAAAPTISMSGAQSISTNSTSISASGIPASFHSITDYAWTLVSGSGTITSPTASTTTVSNLGSGTNVFQCIATQDDGQKTSAGTVSVTYTPIVLSTTTQLHIHGKLKPKNVN